ncbi:uncharacterized protein JCM6883_007592 [Sporobolomyces salmoneus]|uniref:uncharacterized protein n=1 Tax=Sporobolomyces salmoneus TaxID=183962 RepID=UPI003177AD0B
MALRSPLPRHSGKHSRHRHRVDGKKTKPHSREQKSDEHVSKKSHDGKLSKKKDLKENAKVSSRGGCSSTHKVHDKSEPHKTTKKHADAVKTKTATVHKSPSTTKPSSTKETSKPKKDDKASSPVVSNVPVKKPSVLLAESSSPSLSKLAQDSLKLHNDLRSKHKVDSLTWSDELASAAQDWADLCVFQHGKGEEIGAGENLAAYTGADNVASAFDMWSNEVSEYNFDAPGFASNTAHFTQVVWKGTTQVGCAQTLCPTLPIPGQSPFTNAFFYVCEYKAAGNIVGSTPEDTAKSFAANVLK